MYLHKPYTFLTIKDVHVVKAIEQEKNISMYLIFKKRFFTSNKWYFFFHLKKKMFVVLPTPDSS